MYNIAILEANQNQAALLKALIEKNVHKEVLNVITCPSIVELAKYLSDGNVASMLFVDVWMGEEENFSRENATPKGIGIVEKYRRYFTRAQVVYMGYTWAISITTRLQFTKPNMRFFCQNLFCSRMLIPLSLVR